MRPTLLISGGQTGADLGGLAAARALGIPTGGWAPAGWMTENGPLPELLRDTYGLDEAEGDYDLRTELNARDSDGTVIFARHPESDGTAATIQWALHYGKPCLVNPSPGKTRAFVAANRIRTLNVAGNRESVAPGIQAEVEALVTEAFAAADH